MVRNSPCAGVLRAWMESWRTPRAAVEPWREHGQRKGARDGGCFSQHFTPGPFHQGSKNHDKEKLESAEQCPQILHSEYKVTTFPLIQFPRVRSGCLRVKLSSVTEKLGSVFTYLSFVIGTFSAAQNELNAVNCLLLSSS